MDIFLQQVVNGVMLGSAYGLVAVGFSLLFGVLGVANLAHGEVAVLGAYLTLTLVKIGVPLPAAMIIAAIGGGAISVFIERVSFRPFRNVDILIPMLSTVGMVFILQTVFTQIWGADPVSYKVGLDIVTYDLGPVRVSTVHAIILVTAVALMMGLGYAVYGTKFGRGMRAIAESPDKARAIAINAGPIIVLTFAISGPIAAVAGVLVGLQQYALSPFFGLTLAIKALVALVLGGMTNVYGAMIAGLLIGLAETFTTGYLSGGIKDAVVYSVLIVVLLVRPEGLMGEPETAL